MLLPVVVLRDHAGDLFGGTADSGEFNHIILFDLDARPAANVLLFLFASGHLRLRTGQLRLVN